MNFAGDEGGDGALRRVLEDARRELRCGRNKLTVLSPQVDPYRLDTPAGHRDGVWVAEQLERAVGARRIHWRGLHYAIFAAGNIRKPNGEIYRNNDADWTWLTGSAGKAARWLGYVDFEQIIDNRNSDPIIHRKPSVKPETWVSIGLDVTIPDVDEVEPYVGVVGFEGRQPYALTIFGEKTSLEDVLLPIARRFEADLYLPAGEISDALLYRMAKDGAEDGRTMVVLVLADCDPAGHQMAVSIGRKLQALRDLRFGDLGFEVVPVALTVDQVRELELPSTPLKETEKRADRWREAFGVEQTEIDALATLRPRALEEIVTSAIAPYFDASLRVRVAEAEREWLAAAQQALHDQIDDDALAIVREQAAERFGELEAEIDSINQQLRMAIDGGVELPTVVIPEPEVDEKRARLASLISSKWTWAKATRTLIARKAYGGAE
jgi:hypothetical protein